MQSPNNGAKSPRRSRLSAILALDPNFSAKAEEHQNSDKIQLQSQIPLPNNVVEFFCLNL